MAIQTGYWVNEGIKKYNDSIAILFGKGRKDMNLYRGKKGLEKIPHLSKKFKYKNFKCDCMELMQTIILPFFMFVYVISFVIVNVVTGRKVEQRIRTISKTVSLVVIINLFFYIIVLVSLFFDKLNLFILWESSLSIVIGYFLISLGLLLGIISSFTMGGAWRIGIPKSQQPTLITSRVYKISRNPYFLSYHILYIGYFLVVSSLILFLIILTSTILIHLLILAEEEFLEIRLGHKYLEYKAKVGRYFLKF